ncbi:MAG: hypothetical protein Q4E02_01710 [Lagierella massiliensis]|nr:hypothetical protein [Lagierella massiliensis]
MKKFFAIIFALIVVISAYGIYDNVKTKKEQEKIDKMTSVFYGTIESMEEVGEETKFSIKGLEESPKEFKGKVFEYTTDEKFNPINKDGSPADVKLFKEGDEVAIRHIGEIEEGEISKLTGEVTMSPFLNPIKNPPNITDDKAKVETGNEETDGNTNPDKGGKKPTETGAEE